MTDDPDKERGLYGKYLVERVKGEKPGASYFVLDYANDPIAQQALAYYLEIAGDLGYVELARDLAEELRRVGAEHVL